MMNYSIYHLTLAASVYFYLQNNHWRISHHLEVSQSGPSIQDLGYVQTGIQFFCSLIQFFFGGYLYHPAVGECHMHELCSAH